MEKFVPYEKLSKKKQRELDALRRGSWGGLNPVTRKPENPKAYNRKKAQNWKKDSGSEPFLFSVRYSDQTITALKPPSTTITSPVM